MAETQRAITPTEITVQDKPARDVQRAVRMTPSDVDSILEMLPAEDRERHASLFLEKELERQTFEQDQRTARILALSGEFNDLRDKSPEQAFATMVAKIGFGRSVGLDAYDSARYVYFTNGRPSVENDVVASKLMEAGYAWDEDWDYVEEQHKGKPWKRYTGCTLWLKKLDPRTREYVVVRDRKGNPVSESFTEADADHAMIWEKGKQIALSEKFNYKSWPREMYYFRAIGRIRKFHVPHVLRGAAVRAEAFDATPLDVPQTEIAAPAAEPVTEREAEAPPTGKRTLRDLVMEQASFVEEAEPEKPPAPEVKEKKR
jgi:hypothetical protein